MTDPYLAGLRLEGRKVVVVGGGSSVTRRIHRLLNAGAAVTVVAPVVQPAIEALAKTGRIAWRNRDYQVGDLAGAWYAMAATDQPNVNATVVAEASTRQIFCVRADRGRDGTAVTPAVGGHDGVQIGVLAGGDHRRSGRARDALVAALQTGEVSAGEKPAGVALVGGGPGDPELITVRGARLVAQADVIVVDRLAPGELLEGARADAIVVDASKFPHGPSTSQESINTALIDHARAGKLVVRLKGGDPFVFGRGFEELQALAAAGIPAVVVPGVTSAFAAPALAGIPVTHRGLVHEAVVVSGHLSPDHPDSLVDWAALSQLRGTIVILMGLANAEAIAGALITGGRPADTPVAVVAAASTDRQRRVDAQLADLGAAVSDNEIQSPAVIVIGSVTDLGSTISPPA